MKKLLATILSLLAVAALTISAFATKIPETETPEIPENPPIVQTIPDDGAEGDNKGEISPNCEYDPEEEVSI